MLIKLNDQHYVVVDDSVIKEGWVTNGVECFLRESMPEYSDEYANRYWKNITHSTQPELLGDGWMQSVTPLLLSEIEELIQGFSVEKMARERYNIKNPLDDYEERYFNSHGIAIAKSYIEGFKKHQELVKDKLFTLDDMKRFLAKTIENAPSRESHTEMISNKAYRHHVLDVLFDNLIQHFLPKTEWDITIDEQGKISLAT